MKKFASPVMRLMSGLILTGSCVTSANKGLTYTPTHATIYPVMRDTTKRYTVNEVSFHITESPTHKALEQAIEHAHRVGSVVLDIDGEQVWPVEGVGTGPTDEAVVKSLRARGIDERSIAGEDERATAAKQREAASCERCGGWGGGAWNGNESPFMGYLPCYVCGL
jgi:hypothetical protein